jgi:ABC-type uncharacterized transport system permease subunit
VQFWLLLASTLLAAVGGALGMRSLSHGRRSRLTVLWMIGACVGQVGFLILRGIERGSCPLIGLGEVLVFLAWSLTLMYLLVGPTYRLSLLGVFSAPVVVVFQTIAMIPGVMVAHPERIASTNPWRETHAAMSVLGYGALALAAVSSVMFLVLDRQLKGQHLTSGLFRNLPPVRELLVSGRRLLWLGWAMLTIGVVAGLLMGDRGAHAHFIAAVSVWAAYGVLVGVAQFRGLTGRRFSLLTVVMFLVSLSVFALI